MYKVEGVQRTNGFDMRQERGMQHGPRRRTFGRCRMKGFALTSDVLLNLRQEQREKLKNLIPHHFSSVAKSASESWDSPNLCAEKEAQTKLFHELAQFLPSAKLESDALPCHLPGTIGHANIAPLKRNVGINHFLVQVEPPNTTDRGCRK